MASRKRAGRQVAGDSSRLRGAATKKGREQRAGNKVVRCAAQARGLGECRENAADTARGTCPQSPAERSLQSHERTFARGRANSLSLLRACVRLGFTTMAFGFHSRS